MTTSDARDRAIVAKAGPWFLMPPDTGFSATMIGNSLPDPREDRIACEALVRITNRIVREEAKRGKGRR